MANLQISSLLQFLALTTFLQCSFFFQSSNAVNHTCRDDSVKCKDGILVPMWRPTDNLSNGDKVGRAVIYFFALAYLFLGVSVFADRFMAAIEVITSQERTVTLTKADGEKVTLTVHVWNKTVSNLTLMALGSSAPEILLSIIEVCGNGFEAGELGPNTIVGSAAFNLFMIMAICVYVIPSPEVRRQKHLRVFFVTATWSILAYVWLYLILAQITPNQVDWWEGLLTFLFFPLTVLMAWIADRKLLVYKYISRSYRTDRRGLLVGGPGTELGGRLESGDGEKKRAHLRAIDNGGAALTADGAANKLISASSADVDGLESEVQAYEEQRREYLELLRDLRRKHPNSDLSSLQQMAEYEMLNRAHKSRAFYRVAASKKMTGGGNIVKQKLQKVLPKKSTAGLEELDEDAAKGRTARVFFDPGHYTVLENVGTLNVTVAREGGSPDIAVLVDYRTEDGTANAGSDYVPAKGTLVFMPNIHQLQIPVEIIDDDVFEEDEYFYVHLENLRVKTRDGLIIDATKTGTVRPLAQLTAPFTATVMILDDDHAGVFSFEQNHYTISENAGYLDVKVMRSSGARGLVIIPYRTVDGSAIGDRDYERKEGRLTFENDQVEQTITIGIVNDEEYEKDETFFVELGEPIWAKKLSDQKRMVDRFVRRQRRDMKAAEEEEKAQILLKQTTFSKLFKRDKGKSDDAARMPELSEEDAKIADLGKPRLGDVSKCAVKIKESYEFKGVVDRMLKTANLSLVVGTSSWREQFVDALTVSASGDDEEGADEEEKEEKAPSWGDYVMHFISVPWKVLCAFVPPTEYLSGWACFVVAIAMIGFFTAVIGDLANHFGCSIGLKDAVTAISFVAMGTSVPDTFASKVAAVQDKYADGSIGNVTGSNAVNVFLGIGIAWAIAAIYHNWQGNVFKVDAGTLAFSVTIFCVEATVAFVVLMLRRRLAGGELGGPKGLKIFTMLFLISLWLLYLILSGLEAYCVIEGF